MITREKSKVNLHENYIRKKYWVKLIGKKPDVRVKIKVKIFYN